MDITAIPFSFPNVPKVHCLFQTRVGGASQAAYGGGNVSYVTLDDATAVQSNRLALQEKIGCPFSELSQVHGVEVLFEPQATLTEKARTQAGDPLPEADGQATKKTGLALMIKTADCQPILIAHTSGKYIMALHVGWRGNKSAFIALAIERFCEQYSVLPCDLFAVRGPSLGPSVAEFIHFSDEWGQDFLPWYDTVRKTMDLWSLTRHQLHSAGLPMQHIFGLDLCTYTMREHFFSYRQEKESGRQASLIWIEP